MKYGVMSHVMGLQGEDLFRTASSLGFDGMEWSVEEADTDELFHAAGRKAIAKRAADHRLELPSLCLLELNRYGLKESDGHTRSKAMDVIRRSIEAAEDIGMSTILLPFFGASELFTSEEKELVAAGLREVAAEAEAAGVQLAIENTLSAMDNLQLLEAIGSRAVGIYFDVCNSTFWKHPMPADLLRLNEHIVQIHFKDGRTGPWDAMLGQGFVDFPAAARAITDIGYDGWIILESYTPNDSIQDTAVNLAFSRAVMAYSLQGRRR